MYNTQLSPSYSSHKEKVFLDPYESEQKILGEILWNAEQMTQAKAILKSQDFRYGKHQTIFQSMLDMDTQNFSIDVLTLRDFLEERGKLHDVGGSRYLTYLCERAIAEKLIKDSEETDNMLNWLQRREQITDEN